MIGRTLVVAIVGATIAAVSTGVSSLKKRFPGGHLSGFAILLIAIAVIIAIGALFVFL